MLLLIYLWCLSETYIHPPLPILSVKRECILEASLLEMCLASPRPTPPPPLSLESLLLTYVCQAVQNSQEKFSLLVLQWFDIFVFLYGFVCLKKRYCPKENIPSDNAINFSLALILLILLTLAYLNSRIK